MNFIIFAWSGEVVVGGCHVYTCCGRWIMKWQPINGVIFLLNRILFSRKMTQFIGCHFIIQRPQHEDHQINYVAATRRIIFHSCHIPVSSNKLRAVF